MTVKFTYPGDAAAERKLKAEAEAERDRRRQTASESQNAIFDGLRNWAYTMAGQTSFEPVAVWDNGRATAFQFAGQTQVPAVYVVDDDNTERMATFHMQNGMLVAHEVARQWRLRLGGQIICVFNEQYAQAAGPPRGSGTGSSSWMRQVIAGDQ